MSIPFRTAGASTAVLPILTPEDRAEIFANGWRVKPRKAVGTGLGLFHWKKLPAFKPLRKENDVFDFGSLTKEQRLEILAKHEELYPSPKRVYFSPLLWRHDEKAQRCCCGDCVALRNPRRTVSYQERKDRLQELIDEKAEKFKEQMLACGFNESSSVFDDIAFIWKRIGDAAFAESLGIKLDADRESLATSPPIPPKQIPTRKLSVSRPFEGIAITPPPKPENDYWLASYWKKRNKDVPSGALFHEQLLNEIEKVESNHALPSGGTRLYGFGERVTPPTLILHWTDARFEGKPYLIDDTSATLIEEVISSAAPEEWTPPKIQVEYKRDKKVITNVRCGVCGALDKQKYPGSSSLCRVDSDYLCNRKTCIRARSYNTAFDPSRLRAGYPLHELFAPPIHRSVFAWAHSNERNESDPNLKCDQRYDLDRRGRKGIKTKAGEHKDNKDAAARPAKIHTAENTDLVIRYAEDIFHATLVEPVDLSVKIVEYDNTIHHIAGESFEERRHVPNYNCFALNSFVGRKTPSYFDFGNSQVPCKWVDAFIIQGTAPYHIQEYRDPAVSKLDELKTWSDLKAEFKKAGLRWHDPNKLHSSIITLWKETTGAADEKRRQQLDKIKKLKANGRVEQFLEDIYMRKKLMKKVAEEQGTTADAIKQKAYRRLNERVLSENEMWSRAAKTCKKDGLYALATIGGQTRAYLLLAATEFSSSSEQKNYAVMEDGLHNTICDILYRRAKKGTVKEHELKVVYREIYDAFCRWPWRLLRNGVWYGEFGELVVSSAS